jgi:uncharacterized protein (DUF342 family)
MKKDGQFILSISKDKTRAYGTFKPAATGGQPLEISEVQSMISSEGITHGIDWETIRESIFRCNGDHQTLSGILIATGTEPRPELPETLYFSPAIQSLSRIFRQIDAKGVYHPPGEELGDDLYQKDQTEVGGRVDHRERNAIQVIHENQVLAKTVPRRAGDFGMTITGEQIPFSEIEIKTLKPGLNVELRDGQVISTVSGRLVWDKESFGVDTNIEISGEVGYATGNIRFPGNIILKGEIQDGFKIWSGGDIQSKATIDAYEIFCKGDLLCTEGILGRNQGIVRVKGHLEAKFIENCRVDVFGPIRIKTAILNSRVNSNSEVAIEKGKVVGGQLRFRKSLRVADLGNRAGVRTLVIGGVDFILIRQLEHSQQRLEELSGQEQRLKAQAEKTPSSRLTKSLKTIETEIQRLQGETAELLARSSPESDAFLEVSGTAYAGSVIRFGRIERLITEDLAKKRFRLDGEGAQILIEDL